MSSEISEFSKDGIHGTVESVLFARGNTPSRLVACRGVQKAELREQ